MNEWKECTIADLVEINRATYSPKEGWPFVNYLDTGSVTENNIEQIQHLDVKTDKVPSRARRKAVPGSIVYSTVRPNQRHYALIKSVPENFLVSTGFAVLDVKPGVADERFVFSYLTQQSVIDKLQSIAEQGVCTYPALNPDDIGALTVRIPSLPTQRKIAAVLGALDDKIELNRKMNANLEAMAQALFKSWFVDFEPFGGTMPEGWRVGRLFDVVDIFDSKRIPLSSIQRAKMKGDIPYYGATTVMDYVNKAIFNGTFVLMGEDGSVMKEDGTPFLQYVRGAFWANNHAHVMQGRGEFSTEMLYCFLSHTNVSKYVTGAVQLKISQSSMSKMPVVIPDEARGQEIREEMDVIFDKLYKNKEQSRTLAQLRDALLPKLMSGELDVEAVKVEA